jgi:hypothetical protein
MAEKVYRWNKIIDFPFFLFLIGPFFVLYLAAANLGQTSLNTIWPSFILAFGIGVIISIFCFLLVKPSSRAYLVAAVLLVSIFIYGHILNLIKNYAAISPILGENILYLPLFLLIVIGVELLIFLRPAPRSFPTPLFNLLFLGLCLFQIMRIVKFQVSTSTNASALTHPLESTQFTLQGSSSADSPDVYYIILDGLVREDMMKSEYHVQDYNFKEELEKRGFIVPECTFSNYEDTVRSLMSSFNMNYLDAIGIQDSQVINEDSIDMKPVYLKLHENEVLKLFKEKNYKFVSFRGFFPVNDFTEADYYFNFFNDQTGNDNLAERNFRVLFLQTTILDPIRRFSETHTKLLSILPQKVYEFIAPDGNQFSSRSYQWYTQHEYQFQKLSEVPKLPGKKFIYSHFYTTHQPFVYKSDGTLLWPINEDNNGYVPAAQYTTKRILQVIDTLLATSKTPPVIIIQADHGKVGENKFDKFKITNAYYLPNGKGNVIYPTITPVNTFRVVFDQYFGGNFALLPDIINKKVPNEPKYDQTPVDCSLQ